MTTRVCSDKSTRSPSRVPRPRLGVPRSSRDSLLRIPGHVLAKPCHLKTASGLTPQSATPSRLEPVTLRTLGPTVGPDSGCYDRAITFGKQSLPKETSANIGRTRDVGKLVD